MTSKTCPACGTAIDTGHPEGLCPACLLSEGLSDETTRRSDSPRCAKCGADIGPDARFCGQCGAPAESTFPEGDPIRTALETKLHGEYKIVRLLGQGGMGAVYLARDLTLEREVAVKVLKATAHDQETYERFRREARTAARLSHPNIVPLHTFGEVDGMPYFVMGYVRGESLAARLRREGRMTEEEGLRVIGEIADALDHAHRQGVVHRDIKPENVLIDDESGRAMLTDFGVAKALRDGETMTRTGSVIGTPQYMSPEQASGHIDIDGRSDLYSLGVMAYAVLGGRLPFAGTTAGDILRKHLTQDPPPLRSLNASLSGSTASAIERCLAKEPSKRWPDARSLKLALGVSPDDHLPDALHGVEGRGLVALAIFVTFLFVMDLINTLSHPQWTVADRIGPLVTMVFGISLIYVFAVWRIRKEGFTIEQFHATFWKEPSWWLWWYPRNWRRRGNVWDRLPRAVRVTRAILPATFVIPTLFIPAWLLWFSDWFANDRPMEAVVLIHVTVVISVWLVANRRARRELRGKGIEEEDLLRILHSVPPSRVSFWRRPHITPALLPEGEDETDRMDSPHQHFQSILRAADGLVGPLRPLGTEAAAAARQLLASIEEADREIAALARSLDEGEEERLAEKIAALDGEEAAPLRDLLEKELELIRGLSERIEETNEIRSRRVETLRTLSRQIAILRSRAADKRETDPITDRVRAICSDIAAQAVTQEA